MGEGRDRITIDYAVREYTLVNAVIIPGVVRSHLICPRSYSSVRIAGEEGRGPFVIAWPLRGIPRSRVAAPVVNQVELGIVCIPAPRRATTEFPLIFVPSLYTGFLTHWFLRCPISRLVCIKQDVLVRTNAVCAPHELAGFEIIRAEMAADTILSPGDTDDYLVMDNEWSHRHRLTQFRITVLGTPNDAASLRVEGVDMGV